MDFKIIAITAFLLFVGSAGGSPQRALNSFQSPSPAAGKYSPSSPFASSTVSSSKNRNEGEDPKNAKIMKQINKVNEDGSYTFGYEADDGSFRVETRSKDGVVKGKYGYVDANGQLKVMEYTAGEKTDEPTEPEDDDEQNIQRPTGAPIPEGPRYISRQSKPTASVVLPPSSPSSPSSKDQSFAAQTPTGKITGVKYGNENESAEDDKEDEDSSLQKDVNNGQYFRSIGPQPTPTSGSTGGPGAGFAFRSPVSPTPRGQQSGSSDGPRYVPSHLLEGAGGAGAFQGAQYPGQRQGFPVQYAPQQEHGQHQQYQGLGPAGPSSAPQQYQGFNGGSPYTLGQPGQRGGESPLANFGGGQFEDDSFGGQAPHHGSPQFGRPGQSPPNVQVQYRGSPQEEIQGQPPQPQHYFSQGGQGQFGGFPQGGQSSGGRQFNGGRALGGSAGPQQGQYVPNFDLDGFSEDADEDGYVDEQPNSLKGQEQQKQGVAVKAVGVPGRSSGADAYRPQVLGPQGVLQGGFVSQAPQEQFQGGPGQGRNPYLGLGQSQSPQQQLSDDQIQQLFQQQLQLQGSPQQGGGLHPQQYLGGQGQGGQPGFPGQGQFPQQRPQYLQGGQGGSQQQYFSPQQNPLLQGQYQGQGPDQEQFAGFPPQFLPQQGQGFRPQSQGRPQSQQQYEGQFLQGGLGGGSSQGGFPGQGSPQQSQGGNIQSSGFPFDYSPLGILPGQGQQFNPQQGGGPQQLSQQQLAAILQAQQGQGGFSPQGSPQNYPGGIGPQGFSGGFPTQGYVPGRFPGGQGGPQGFPPQQQQSPQFLGQSSGGGVQLGGGPPRPVQQISSGSPSSPSSSGGLFGGDERKSISSRGATPSKSN